ncbi:MAG: transporter substrate-binding domain-containing protein [Anaerolineales bacterium]|nr:transporter substrate-binding domain-containing protein [Anaerolineales bacterium]
MKTINWHKFLWLSAILAVSLVAAGCSQTSQTTPAPTVIAVSPTSDPPTDDNAIRLVYSDVEAYPIQMGNGETVADPPGIVIEIIAQAAKELGLNIIVERRPNKRVLTELEEGTADGAFSYSYKEERLINGQYPMKDGQLDSSSRLVTISYYVYKMKDSPLDWDGSQFINLDGAIGANAGYSIVDDLRNKGVEVEEAKSTEQNFEKLKLGRIAGYATQDITADRIVESGQYGEIVKVPTPLATKDYFLMFSHQFMEKHPDIAEKLWTKIGALRDSVTEEVLPKY